MDTYTGTNPALHPSFTHVFPGDGSEYTDAVQGAVTHAAAVNTFASEVWIGLPGVALPGAPTGTAGFQAWFGQPSTNGQGSGLTEDCRNYITGGLTAGVTEKGTMNWLCGQDTAAAVVDGSPGDLTITSGGTYVAPDSTDGVILHFNGTLAAYTVQFPPNPHNKQTFHITAEGTITALTLSTVATTNAQATFASGITSAAGVTPGVIGSPGTITTTTPVTFVYDNLNSTWTRW